MTTPEGGKDLFNSLAGKYQLNRKIFEAKETSRSNADLFSRIRVIVGNATVAETVTPTVQVGEVVQKADVKKSTGWVHYKYRDIDGRRVEVSVKFSSVDSVDIAYKEMKTRFVNAHPREAKIEGRWTDEEGVKAEGMIALLEAEGTEISLIVGRDYEANATGYPLTYGSSEYAEIMEIVGVGENPPAVDQKPQG